MIRHTGGVAVGEISTRSRFFLAGQLERIVRSQNADLLAFIVDDANFPRPNAIVCSDKAFIDTALR